MNCMGNYLSCQKPSTEEDGESAIKIYNVKIRVELEKSTSELPFRVFFLFVRLRVRMIWSGNIQLAIDCHGKKQLTVRLYGGNDRATR